MREKYVLHKGQWVPRSHLYDYGEEPIYMGPRRRKCPRRLSNLVGFVVCCPLYCYVIKELLAR
jgi:hypothetical protein